MRTLCIVPCGAKKIWDENPNAGPTPAKKVYVGSFAGKCREYAVKFYPNSWCILSAKYGFLFPDDYIPGPYNVSFNDKKTNPISLDELSVQVGQKGLDVYEEIVVLGGKNYVSMIKRVFRGKSIYTPLYGCSGMGYMMQKMNDAINRGIKL